MTKQIFNSGYKITQHYAANPAYYSRFGLKGHEGVDFIPQKWNDRPIYAIEGGTVVRDIDSPRQGGAYGNTVVILNKTNKRAWWYCHLLKNAVSIGQTIKKGQYIGDMGNTGNSSGDHLHLGLRYADSNGNAINTNNGYQGFVNPLPVVRSLLRQSNNTNSDTNMTTHEWEISVEDQKTIWEKLKRNKAWDAQYGILSLIEGLQGQVKDFEKDNKNLDKTIKAQGEELIQRKKDIIELEESVKYEQVQAVKHMERNAELMEINSDLQTELEILTKANQRLEEVKKEVTHYQEALKKCQERQEPQTWPASAIYRLAMWAEAITSRRQESPTEV